MRGWNYVELERYCESLKEERDKYRQEAMQERELTQNIVAEREELIIENERLNGIYQSIEALRNTVQESSRIEKTILVGVLNEFLSRRQTVEE